MLRGTAFFILFACLYLQPAHAQQKPIPFIENKGQWPSTVVASADVDGGKMYIESWGLTYDFADSKQLTAFSHQHTNPSPEPVSPLIRCHSYRVFFEGAEPSPAVQKSQPSLTSYNFLKGKDPGKWGSDARAYESITLTGIYPGTDVHYYSSHNYLKYDFVLHPGSDPSRIKLRYDSVSSLGVTTEGHLLVRTTVNEVTELSPFAYQLIQGDTVVVPCNYQLKGNQLSFLFPRGYDRRYSLVIDPTLKFSTYTGSTADNFGYTATFDIDGFLYTAGSVFAQGYPLTSGAYETNYQGAIDIGISKFDTTGTRMIYSTYLGGSETELPHSLIVNQDQELYLYGTTSSLDYPVTANAAQPSFGGGFINTLGGLSARYQNGSDIVVTKLNRDGNGLLGSTYIGGSNNDGLNLASQLKYNYADQIRGEIQLDENDNVFVASSTYSNNFPKASLGFQKSRAGGQDGILFRMNSTLSTIVWATYLGGTDDDACYSLDFSRDDKLVVGGGTSSQDMAVSTNAVQALYGGGRSDGFMALTSTTGDMLEYLSYWGGNQYDQVYQVEVDKANRKYMLGQTEDKSNRFYDGTVYGQNNSGQFISKFSSDFTALTWTTTFGKKDNVPNISPVAFLVDACNKIYVTGWGGGPNLGGGFVTNNSTDVSGLQVTNDAYRKNTDGDDFYILVLEADAAGLDYASYYGGDQSAEHVDGGTSRFDKRGIIYESVCAGCQGHDDFPIYPPNAHSPTNNSPNCNNGVFKMDFGFAGVLADFKRTLTTCINDTIYFENRSLAGLTYTWKFHDGQTTTTNNTSRVYTEPGVYEVTLYATNPATCNITDSITKEVVIYPLGTIVLPDTVICVSDSVRIGPEPLPRATYRWTPGTGLSDSTIANPFVLPGPEREYTLEVTGGGCIGFYKIKIAAEGTLASFSNSDTNCLGSQIIFNNTSIGGLGYEWDFGDNSPRSSDTNPSHSYTTPGQFTVRLVSFNSAAVRCPNADTAEKVITIYPNGRQILPDTLLCAGDSVQIGPLPLPGASYRWTPPDYLSDPTASNPIAKPLASVTYRLLILSPGGCADTTDVGLIIDGLLADFTVPPICMGDSARFTNASQFGESFEWDFGDQMTSTEADPVHYFASPGRYQVMLIAQRASAGDKCAKADTIIKEIMIYPHGRDTLPNLVFCPGQDTVTLGEDSLPGASYQWFDPSGLSDPFAAQPLVYPIHNRVFTRIITAFGCSDTSVVKLELEDINLLLSMDSVVCSSPVPYRLTADGKGRVNSFTWSADPSFSNPLNNGPADSTIDVTVNQLQTFYVLGTTAHCQFTDSIRLVVLEGGTTALPEVLICPGDSAEIGLSSTSTGYSYRWQPANRLSNDTIPNPYTRTTDSLTYVLTVTTSGCFQYFTQKVDVSRNSFKTDSIINICDDRKPLQLIADGKGTMQSYRWSDDLSFQTLLNTDTVDSTAAVFPPGNITYYIQAYDGVCYHFDSVEVRANFIYISLADSQFICEIDTLLVAALNFQGKSLLYDWLPKTDILGSSTNDTAMIWPGADRYYTVTVTDSLNCRYADSIFVKRSALAALTPFIQYSDTIMYRNNPVHLEGFPSGNFDYAWSPPEFASAPYEQSTDYMLEDSVTVTLTLRDGPCYKSDSIWLSFKEITCGPPDIFIPNAFTPNADGNNDLVFVRGKYIYQLYFAIYDRWGEKVFETTDPRIGWDGTYKGNLLDPAVFVYYLEATCIDRQQYFEKGNITLIR